MDGKIRPISMIHIAFLFLLQVISASNNQTNDPTTIHLQVIQPQNQQLAQEGQALSNMKNQTAQNATNQDAVAGTNMTNLSHIGTNHTASSQNASLIQNNGQNSTVAAANKTMAAQEKLQEQRKSLYQQMKNRQKMKKYEVRQLTSTSEKFPEYEYDSWEPEPDKNSWDSQTIKYPTATDYPKRFRSQNYNWWQPSYEKKLEPYQENFLKYGYKGEGFKAGNYYTKYISPNPKFYQKDKFYGTEIYTPFWNHMRNKYQQVDCGIDCEYLGPKDYLGSMFLYIVLFCAFIIVASLALCGKQKFEQERQIERARELGQNILHI